MTTSIAELAQAARLEIAAADSSEAIQSLKIKYLGRKGLITGMLREVSKKPLEERAEWGKS
jgi:phenylalanyl-tRNA synthetase alpha chain